MNLSKRIQSAIVAGILITTAAFAQADDLQDANKLFKQDQQAQALDKVNGYLSTKPKDAQGRFLKGLILTKLGKTDEAIKMFSDLTVDFPDLPEPYNNLAVLYAGQGQYDKARQSLEQAISTHPSYATAHENLGDIYAKMASQAYNRALQLDKNNTATQTKLAMIQELFSADTHSKITSIHNASSSNVATAVPVNSAVSNIVAIDNQSTGKGKSVVVGGNDNSDVIQTVHDWASAWSAQNVDKYLAAYASDFHPADGQSHDDWAATRRERVSKPKFIRVTLRDMTVQMADSTHATATFEQTYVAGHLHIKDHKTLGLVKVDGKWLIQEERTR